MDILITLDYCLGAKGKGKGGMGVEKIRLPVEPKASGPHHGGDNQSVDCSPEGCGFQWLQSSKSTYLVVEDKFGSCMN